MVPFFGLGWDRERPKGASDGFGGRENNPSSALWECGNRGVGDFQGRWEEWKTVVWFSTLSTARHFHSGSASGEALDSPAFPAPGQQGQFRLLHPSCRRGVAHSGGFPLQPLLGNSFLQILLPARQRSELLIRRPVIPVPINALALAPPVDLNGGE